MQRMYVFVCSFVCLYQMLGITAAQIPFRMSWRFLPDIYPEFIAVLHWHDSGPEVRVDSMCVCCH